MRRLPIPSIVVIEGRAAGDFLEFALLCDFRLAAEDAQLDFGVENGRLPSVAAIQRLSGLIGEMKVKELIFFRQYSLRQAGGSAWADQQSRRNGAPDGRGD